MEDPVKSAKLNILFPNKKPQITDPLEFKEELYRYISNCTNDKTLTNSPAIFISYAIVNIRPVIQCGLPICGMVAMTMAYQLLNNSTQVNPSVQPLSLLTHAQDCGYTKQGELLSASTMLQLSTETLSCDGMIKHIDELTLEVLLKSMFHRNPILVPYDCDKDHTPFLAQGHEAHWCLIVGVIIKSLNNPKYCVKDPHCDSHFELSLGDEAAIDIILDHVPLCNVTVIARHGKSRHLGFWQLKQLQESNSNLMELNPHYDPDTLVVPPEGLAYGLQSKFILLKKQS